MKISVIVPFYNVEPYFSRCISSIISQSLKDIEIILVNDGSTDKSLDIAYDFANKDNRIIVISQKNAGQACARNTGLKIAKGDYVAFIDSDDWLEHNMLENLLHVIEENNAEVVQCRFQFDNESTGQTTPSKIFDHKILSNKNDIIVDALLVKNIFVAPWAKLFRRSFLISNGLWFEEGIVNEDTLFTLKFACYADSICFSNKILYHAIERDGSTSRSSYLRLCSHMVIALNKAKEFFIAQGIFGQLDPLFKARYLKSVQYNLLQAAQRLEYNRFREVWQWNNNVHNTDYKKYNCHNIKKILPLRNRLMLSPLFNNCISFFCVVKIANIFNIKMH